MNENRNLAILNLRPEIKKVNNSLDSSDLETFQNTTIRPIIKFQHPILLLILKNHLDAIKYDLKKATLEKKSEFISNALQSNKQLNLQLTHTITALFSKEEYLFYNENSKDIHKRIVQICRERFLTNLDSL